MSALEDLDDLDRLLGQCNKPPEGSQHTPSPSTPYDEVGKLRWSLKAVLANLRPLRYKLGLPSQQDELGLVIRHIEDALHRMDRAINSEDNIL